MSDDIKWETRDNAFEVILILYCCLISLANVVLFARLYCAVGGFKPFLVGRRGARCLTFAFMAIGDIFGGFFAFLSFLEVDEDKERSYILLGFFGCEKNVLPAWFFLLSIMPCVYGCGLIFLCFESAFYRHTKAYINNVSIQKNSFVKNAAFAALPWIVGLSISMPLSFVDLDFEFCKLWPELKTRYSLLHSLCVFRPVFFVLLSAFTINFVASDADDRRTQVCGHDQAISNVGDQNHPEASAPSMISMPGTCHPDYKAHGLSALPPYSETNSPNLSANASPQTSQASPASSSNILRRPLNIRRERLIHIASAIVFTLCMLPFPIYHLLLLSHDVDIDIYNKVEDIALYDMFFVIFASRGFIMPCIWFFA